jgi:hypothetical protein
MNKTTKTYALPYVFFSILGYLLYFHTLGFGFTYFDDAAIIIETFRSAVLDPASMIRLFTQNHISSLQPQVFYRPIFGISLMINGFFSKGALAGYYFTNITLHIIASCLVYNLLIRLKHSGNAALLLATLYVVHPIMTQAVAWLPGRSDTLAAIFSIASFIAFIDFARTPKFRHYFTHLLFLALALFSKENALSLVIICFLYERLIMKRKIFSSEEKFILPGWIVVLTSWFILRNLALVDPLKISFYEMACFMAANFIVIIQYIGRIFFPLDLSVWPTMRDSGWMPGAWGIIILVILLAFSRNRRLNYCLFGAAWFILFLLPSIARPGTGILAIFSNTRAYLPVAGLLIILAETDMIKYANIKKWTNAVIIFLALAFYSLVAYKHSYDFSDSSSFWENARRTSPHSWVDPAKTKK